MKELWGWWIGLGSTVWWRLGIGLVAVIVMGALWWLWWILPKRVVAGLRLKVRDPKARADIEDNFRKTVGQALGGIAVLIGAGMAYYGTQQTLRVNEDESHVSQQASHDLLISQQVSKGFEQLGGDKRVVRLGGIYALEGVMNTSDQYHQPVVEALCAFVRDSTKTDDGEDHPPATDIQAALTVIGRRLIYIEGRKQGGTVDLKNAHVSNAYLYRANFAYGDLSSADLTGANLEYADLTHSTLIKVNLIHADLEGATLTGASLNEADLSLADLKGGPSMNGVLPDAKVSQAQLDQACGEDARLPPGMTLKPCQTVRFPKELQ